MIVDRTNTSAETMQFLMDGVVESTITEASVGTAAWQAAVDHGFFIIFDLAIGGNYPDGVYGATTPTSATSSGASMSVGYVAVYEEGGNSTPLDRQRDRDGHRAQRAVPGQPELAQHVRQPARRDRLQR